MLWVRIKNKLICERNKQLVKKNLQSAKKSVAWQRVATIDQTLDALLNEECSLCRFGDGEYKIMAEGKRDAQHQNDILAIRLRKILRSNVEGVLIAIPNIREDMRLRTPKAKEFWEWFIQGWGQDFVRMLCPDKKYYNAHVTRLYMDYRECGRSAEWFDRLKQLWQGKQLLIVEGEKTRMGVGNDLLSGAKSIKRILCPSHDAFLKYEDIMKTVKSVWKGELVLIALGQTATVLAYDLHCAGIRAIDIGHIDVEYEWFLAGVEEKTAVAGKLVREVDSQLPGKEDSAYLEQIVARVGVG